MYCTDQFKKKKDNRSFILKGGLVKTKLDAEDLQEQLKAIKQGTGRHASKKDYKRRDKHIKNYGGY